MRDREERKKILHRTYSFHSHFTIVFNSSRKSIHFISHCHILSIYNSGLLIRFGCVIYFFFFFFGSLFCGVRKWRKILLDWNIFLWISQLLFYFLYWEITEKMNLRIRRSIRFCVWHVDFFPLFHGDKEKMTLRCDTWLKIEFL